MPKPCPFHPGRLSNGPRRLQGVLPTFVKTLQRVAKAPPPWACGVLRGQSAFGATLFSSRAGRIFTGLPWLDGPVRRTRGVPMIHLS